MKTLAQLDSRVAFETHIVLDEPIPVLDGLQAQGDVIALPYDPADRAVIVVAEKARWIEVPRGGVTLVEGAHPHVLDADPGVCWYTLDVTDASGLAVAAVRASEPVYLLHPEHGGMGLAAGSYAIRRQREQATEQRLVAD